MKIRSIAVAVLLLAASFVFADEPEAVLTVEGVVYTVSTAPARQLEVVKRVDDERTSLPVPTTEDAALESDARLLWDAQSKTLYVVWRRIGERGDQIMLARMNGDERFSDPLIVATGGAVSRAGLTATFTKVTVDATKNETATLVHLAWWSMGAVPAAEYGLVAFENEEHVSTTVTDLASLAGISDAGIETEMMGEVAHPPLAVERLETSGVDVVFGSTRSTALTRVTIVPKLAPNARLWKPSRGAGGFTPRAVLQSATGAPVKTILNRGRIVLYEPGRKFRFVIYDKGKWTPERSIKLDENLTSEQVVQELRKVIEGLEGEEQPTTAVIE